MFISEVIIDGFKSYAQRTVVSGFDPQFNAITGLNGSGKSNILDAICFVLGISNLSQVRVGNLQELVYKQGQAGVTKATVTIVFNNSDTASSPLGYESHKQITVTRQVVIGGKNKYLINGHTVQQSQVQNLFHSVQLNVNNPHFLIMQGRITKVLNMKPAETLSMIEEAAGTRMFETKKQAAIKTIEKKQLKVEELTKCMEEEINPTLEKLREERRHYLTWQSNTMELERLERFCVASQYRAAEEKVTHAENDKAAIEAELAGLESVQKEMTAQADECVKKAAEISRQREEEMSGDFQELKKAEAELSKELVKCSTLLTNQKETLASEKDALVQLLRQAEGSAVSLTEKNAELQRCTAELRAKEEEAAAAEKAVVSLREKHQNALAGVADASNAQTLSLPEQVLAWERRAREAESQMQQGNLRAQHAQEKLKELRKSIKTQQASHTAALKEAETLRKAVQTLEQRLGGAAASNIALGELRTRAQALRQICSTLTDRVETITAQLQARLNFEFKDPERGFDRSRVKGLVARLIRVPDSRTTTALEIVAGAKLYQVVVDNEKTGKLLLEKGGLRKRVTILPLSKLSGKCTDASKVSAAKSIASAHGGTAHLALELVGYESEVRKAMELVFGNTLVCDTPEVAKAVAFDRAVRNKTVTYDGEVYDPAGTVTGGSTSSLGVLLARISELAAAQEELDQKQAELNAVTAQLNKLESDGAADKDLASKLELKQHELRMCEERLAESTYAQSMNEIEQLEQQVAANQQENVSLQAAVEDAKKELKKLKSAESDVKKQREQAMREMESQLKSAKKVASDLKAEVLAIRNRKDAIVAEIAEITKEAGALKDQEAAYEASIRRMTGEGEALEAKLSELRASYDETTAALAEKQKELNKSSKEIKALEAEKEKALKSAQAASLEARKLQHKLKAWEKDFKDASKALTALTKEHPWIAKEKDFFGMPGSDFDFTARDVPQSMKRLKEIKAEQDKLSKKINKKVMGMIEKAESEYQELSRKREVIMNDKAKIEAVIEELDVKKAQALQTTWVKVNRDFGSIFSMLLPGTTAKLEPLEGCAVSEGLEVKVAFNSVWKESLTELSGGQRSLLALSLILALLLFKPAPMYILDEVDAALDLSHTQNIGLMLRTHFSTSQFIVVSLKEGMFNNANVIFRTRFIDGISTVTRTIGRGRGGKDSMLLTEDRDEAMEAPSKKKGKATAGGKRGAGKAEAENLELVEA